jgi:PncC family amidohydrolase
VQSLASGLPPNGIRRLKLRRPLRALIQRLRVLFSFSQGFAILGAYSVDNKEAELMSHLEEIVARLLTEQGLTIAVAESCTGGLIAHQLTNVSGSSVYFMGGVVAYSNEVKERVLGVSGETLAAYGAVSEECAREMARGARRLFDTDVAISSTGIAGPTGGTPQKPVGLVYVALAAQDMERCERHLWRGDRLAVRLENKRRTSEAALEMLRQYLEAR